MLNHAFTICKLVDVRFAIRAILKWHGPYVGHNRIAVRASTGIRNDRVLVEVHALDNELLYTREEPFGHATELNCH